MAQSELDLIRKDLIIKKKENEKKGKGRLPKLNVYECDIPPNDRVKIMGDVYSLVIAAGLGGDIHPEIYASSLKYAL